MLNVYQDINKHEWNWRAPLFFVKEHVFLLKPRQAITRRTVHDRPSFDEACFVPLFTRSLDHGIVFLFRCYLHVD